MRVVVSTTLLASDQREIMRNACRGGVMMVMVVYCIHVCGASSVPSITATTVDTPILPGCHESPGASGRSSFLLAAEAVDSRREVAQADGSLGMAKKIVDA